MTVSPHWYELCHVTLVRCPQFGTDQRLRLLAVVNSAQDGDCSLHVVCSEVFQSARTGLKLNSCELCEELY